MLLSCGTIRHKAFHAMNRPPTPRPAMLMAIALLLAAVLLAVMVYIWTKPTVLRVAVGPDDRGHAQLMAAFAQRLNIDHAPIRLRLVRKNSLNEAAQAVDAKEADLAVVRSDHMPRDGQTLAILNHAPLLFVAPASSKLRKTGQLVGKRVGILRGTSDNQNLLQDVLNGSGARTATVHMVVLNPSEIATAFQTHAIDAFMVASPLQGGMIERVLEAAAPVGGAPVLFGLEEAEALARRNRAYESLEVPAGSFAGTPPRPASALTTLAVTQQLVARSSLDDTDAGDLTKLLFTKRAALAAQAPQANAIEALDPDDAANAGLHPGARAYYAGEQLSFIERYADWAYIGMAIATMVASSFGALFTYFRSRKQQAAANLIYKVQQVLAQVRDCDSMQQLNELQRDADDLLGDAIGRYQQGEMNAEQFSTFTIVNQNLNFAIQQRETQLTGLRSALSDGQLSRLKDFSAA